MGKTMADKYRTAGGQAGGGSSLLVISSTDDHLISCSPSNPVRPAAGQRGSGDNSD
jgi:hypothetical protein